MEKFKSWDSMYSIYLSGSQTMGNYPFLGNGQHFLGNGGLGGQGENFIILQKKIENQELSLDHFIKHCAVTLIRR